MGCVFAQTNVKFDWLGDEEDREEIQEEPTKKSSKQNSVDRPLLGLVLAPTRELAIQVKDHIDAAARHTGIMTCVVVGGMAAQKQERLLKKCPEIVIATPGRLWELIQEVCMKLWISSANRNAFPNSIGDGQLGLNIFYLEEKDWVQHEMQQCPLLRDHSHHQVLTPSGEVVSDPVSSLFTIHIYCAQFPHQYYKILEGYKCKLHNRLNCYGKCKGKKVKMFILRCEHL